MIAASNVEKATPIDILINFLDRVINQEKSPTLQEVIVGLVLMTHEDNSIRRWYITEIQIKKSYEQDRLVQDLTSAIRSAEEEPELLAIGSTTFNNIDEALKALIRETIIK